jgi:hypothetical protein
MFCRGVHRFMIFVGLGAIICATSPFPSDARPIELTNLELIFEKSFRQTPTLYAYGISISSAGDVNSDGYDDIITAWASWDTLIPVRPWLAKAFIFFGGNPMDTIADVILTGDRDGEAFVEVCGAGDVNSDGFDDVVLSNHSMEAVRLFFGGDPMDTTYDVVLMNNVTYSYANSLSPAGDVNGDGYDDIIIGDYTSHILNGSAAIFFGGPGLNGQPDVILNGHADGRFGMQVVGGGDLDCDGYDDVVVGEDENSEFAPWAGKVYIFLGGSPMDTIPDVWLYGEGGGHWLGGFQLGVLRMDGICDWVVAGTPFYPYGFPADAPGKVYVLFGDTLADGAPATLLGTTDSSGLGYSTRSSGRVADAPFDGLVSGAPTEHGMRGSVYLWLTDVPFDTMPDAIATGAVPNQCIGWNPGSAGDVNGDGYDEIMFCNYATHDSIKSVWICRYTGTAVSEKATVRDQAGTTVLLQNHPNPFTSSTTIRFQVSSNELPGSSLDVYDAVGGHIRNLWWGGDSDGGAPYPVYSVRWDGTDKEGKSVSAGVYFCRLSAGRIDTRKMVVLR